MRLQQGRDSWDAPCLTSIRTSFIERLLLVWFLCSIACAQAKIVEALDSFYKQEIAGKLSDESLVFDAYVRERDHRVFLIDINPFGGLTQPLLYSWAELLGDEVGAESPELRVIADHPSIRPSMSMYGRLPKEMRDVSTQEGINELVTSCAAMDQVNEAERA